MKIKDILAKGQPTLSFEVFPPKEESNFASVDKVKSVIYERDLRSRRRHKPVYGPDRIGYPEHLPGAGAVTSDLRLLDP